ncbi:hypothetical protein PENTCL1PPCAC_29751, partial [Pristionchus entomophagus]
SNTTALLPTRTSKMSFEVVDFRQCLVCYTSISSMRLEMDICRACSLFFTRAKVTGVQYPCRQGTGQCTVAKDGKFACRRCRFDRCVSVGVVYDGPMRIRRTTSVPLLYRVGKEFRAFSERRQARELKLLRTCGVRMPHPTMEIYYVCAPASIQIYTIAIVEALNFFEKAFPTLKQLETKERETIFKDYAVKLNLIAGYHCGKKIWNDFRTKVMCSAITCYDTTVELDLDYCGPAGSKNAILSTLRTHIEDHIAVMVPIFERSRLTETEFHGLSALIMTDHDMQLSEKAHQLIDDIRREIFDNLHLHYTNEMALTDYSIRLGNLMSLNHTVQECCAIFRTFFRFFSAIFDTYMVARSMGEFLLGS